MISGIYRIKNILNNKCYYGSSKDINKRWNRHKNELNKNKHGNILLQKSWNKYGNENFIFEIIEECDINLLLEKEQYYLDKNPEFNISKKSSGCDNISDNPNRNEIIKKMSIANKLKYENLSQERKSNISLSSIGEKNYNYGKKWSDDKKKRASEIKKEYYKNHEHYNKNKKFEDIYDDVKSKELRNNLSKLASERVGEKNPFYGKHHTEEYKNKSRIRQIGVYNGNQNIPFSINGKIYNSLGESSKDLNIPITTIRWRIKSNNKKFYEYKYI